MRRNARATREQHSYGDAHRVSEVDGLRVVTELVPGVRSVSVGAWIDVGSRHERDDTRGYAHFLEHLLFKGNDRIDAADISRFFDAIGTDANAATTREYTVVHARVLDRHVRATLEVLGDMVLAPALAVDDVDAEREVILEEIAMYEDSPGDVVHEIGDELVFGDHGLGRPIVGTSASIASATAGELAGFHRQHYAPERIVISAAGALDHDEFVAAVEEQFVAARALHQISDARSLAPPGRHVPQARLRHKETEQVHLVLAGRGIARDDPRRYAAAVLDTIFGNAPSSRLFLEVRERRGLAYSVYSYLANHAGAGEAGIYVGVRPDRVRTVLDVLKGELERITTQAPTPAELALAHGHIEGRMLLSLESTTARANRLGSCLATRMPIEPLEQTVERIRAVTAEDVLALAQSVYHPATLSFAAVADDVEAVRDAARRALPIAVDRYEIDGAPA